MLLPLQAQNPHSRGTFIIYLLMVINVGIFIFQVALGPLGEQFFIFKTSVVPLELTHFDERNTIQIPGTSLAYPDALVPFPLTILTAMFVHGGFMHLGGNLLYLWIFGNSVEGAMGSIRFLLFYIITGLGATLVHIISEPESPIPMIGASGAIAGVLGAYFVLYPRTYIKTFILLFIFIQIIHIPAIIILGFWFLRQFLGIGSDGVAWYAHIGGFLIGMLMVQKFLKTGKAKFINTKE